MVSLIPSDLRDPQPPVPGERERALVAARAHKLGRRRHLAQGAGALALVAALGVSVAALTAGGSSGADATNRVQAATAAPQPTSAQTPSVAPQDAAPAIYTLSGTVSDIPEGITVTLTLTGSDGSFDAMVDGAGTFSVSGLAAGDYSVIGQWVDSSGTATAATRLGTVSITGDSSVSLTFPG